MWDMLTASFFYLISFGILVLATIVVLTRSAVYSVLALVGTMCLIAGLFVLLKAFLVAAILVLVYAGAILVLFLFIVMMIDIRSLPSFKSRGPLHFGGALFLGAFVVVQVCKVAQAFPAGALTPAAGDARSVGLLLFGRYALPFELTSLFLLAAVVSVAVLAKKEIR